MNLMQRFWRYQQERFPLIAHGLLVAALVVGSSGFATAGEIWPPPRVLAVSFVVALGTFFLLRVADEFKDAATDAAHRPYRPVPRGLITLRELARIGVGVALAQLTLILWLDPGLLGYLLVLWGVMVLMGREYFVGEWLKARPLLYTLSHMLVLPLLILFLLAAAWRTVGARPAGIGWFLAASYANGLVFEVGRKLRAPEAEELGVETYSALWGVGHATWTWTGALGVAALCGALAGRAIGLSWLLFVIIAGGVGAALVVAWRMACAPSVRRSKGIEGVSALWVLALYLALGLLPHL